MINNTIDSSPDSDRADSPWITIVGIGEDGLDGLSRESRQSLEASSLIIGAPRHLSLVAGLSTPTACWPDSYGDWMRFLETKRPGPVSVLASGDPFFHGIGTRIAAHFKPEEWQAFSALSCVALAGAHLGWPLEKTPVLGLHAAPLTRLRPCLAPGQNILVLLRDAEAVGQLATYLQETGFGPSILHILQRLGGPCAHVSSPSAKTFHTGSITIKNIEAPVLVGIEVNGNGAVVPTTSGIPDSFFDHDGQITKQPVRALTLSALAPKPGDYLWDIGAGSGSIAIEWLLSHPANTASAVERDPDRAARLTANAKQLGVDRLQVICADAHDALKDTKKFKNTNNFSRLPDCVFIGGGLDEPLLQRLLSMLPAGTRLVANAVTLDTQSLLQQSHQKKGGTLRRIELSDSAPLGTRQVWKAAYPLTQWAVIL